MINKVLSTVFVVVLFAIVGPHAIAQTNDKTKAITIEPFLQEVVLDQDQPSKSFTVSVTNNTASPFRFKVEAVDFGTLNETGGVFFSGTESLKLANKYGLANWIQVENPSMELPAGAKTTINVTLLNRDDLAPGGHYGALFISSSATPASKKSNVALRQSLSALILAIKRGGEKYDMSLASLRTNGSWFQPPTTVKLRFKNGGNTHIVPRGIIKLTDTDATYAKGIINDSSGYILPETFRQIPVPLSPQKKFPLRLFYSKTLEVDYRYEGLDRFGVKTYRVRWVNWTLVLGLMSVLVAGFFIVNYFFGSKIEKFLKKLSFKKLNNSQ